MEAQRTPERALRQLWYQQNFALLPLRTTDGRPVEVLSPGSANSNGGPDFINARIRIDGRMYTGDVEIHIDAREWCDHGHDRDPHYNRTILHVVLNAGDSGATFTHSGRAVPLLIAASFIAKDGLSSMPTPVEGTAVPPLPCRDTNDQVPPEIIRNWIERLAWERIELKVRRFEERLKELIDEERQPVREPHPLYYENPDDLPPPQKVYNRTDYANKKLWEQLLYEGIMDALGFSKNRRPFAALAQSVRIGTLRSYDLSDSTAVMAVLFGAAGLLPRARSIPERESRRYVRRLRKRWAAIRPSFRGTCLHEGDWLFFRLRPSNFPTSRLAAICFLLPVMFGVNGLQALLTPLRESDLSPRERSKRLHALMKIEPDGFWKRHHYFTGSASNSGVALGPMRRNDILINVIIPFALLFARVFGDQNLRETVRALAAEVPPSQENSITRKMKSELLKEKIRFRTAIQQQGAIQLYRWYCAKEKCGECEVGGWEMGR